MYRTLTALAATATFLVAAAEITPANARDIVTRKDGKTVVDAPTTRVRVKERSGETRVHVRAPHTRVSVDTERRRVRIRVPYYSGDISW